MKCRYTGHSRMFYSVAEHAVLVSTLLYLNRFSMKDQFAGLHHDDTEAYLPDVASPLKDHIKGYRDIEDNLACFLSKELEFEWPENEKVKLADQTALYTEMSEVFLQKHKVKNSRLRYLSPAEAMDAYLDRHFALSAAVRIREREERAAA